MRRTAATALSLLFALSAVADPLGDVRTALGRLTAVEPIRATYELTRGVVSEGKFGNDRFSGKATVELEGDASGFRLGVSRPLLHQIEREKKAKTTDPKQTTPTVSALSEIDPVDTSDAIDFAPALLRLLQGAKLVSNGDGTWGGKPARVMVLRVADGLDEDDAKKMKISENRLTLWLGTDSVPLAAEHIHHAKISFLIFKADLKKKRSWHFARVADRLVRVRHESSEATAGMGQKGNESLLATVRVH